MRLFVVGVMPPDQAASRIFVDISGSSNGDPSKTDTENVSAIDISNAPVRIIIDDTDDDGGFTGSGVVTDPDDVMRIEEADAGTVVTFLNEAWNLGESEDVINLSFASEISQNLPDNMSVEFRSEEGDPLEDSDGNGEPDIGPLQPETNGVFITRVNLLPGVEGDAVTIGVRGTSVNDNAVSDVTFNVISSVAISEIEPDNVVIQATVLISGTTQNEPLVGRRIIAYEFDNSGNLVRGPRVFLTDENGTLLFDESGELSPLAAWMRDDFQYRLTLDGEFNNFSYFLTPTFFKSDFEAVSEPGETFTRGEITITVAADGSRILETPLDPAGFVFDAITGEKINGACATFNRCDDGADCTSFTPVDASRLDLLPDGVTTQENPQVTGPNRAGGINVATGSGAFQFQFAAFRPGDEGFYFVGIDFDCGDPASDPTLADRYDPVGVNSGSIWNPFSGDLYTGEPFFVDLDFPQTSLLRVPLLPDNFEPLEGEKSVTPATAMAGESLQFTISIHNNNPHTVFNPEVLDELPSTLRYRAGTTEVDGVPVVDPELSNAGQVLTWRLSELAPDQRVIITFEVEVEEDSESGAHVNTARAMGSTDLDDSIRLTSTPFEVNFDIERFEPLFVEKTVSPFSASIGDLLLFTLVARNNNANSVVFNPVVVDRLPAVLRYRKGSTRIDNVRADNPEISEDGRELTWNVGDLDPGQSRTITFYAVITGSARNKTFTNVALADGSTDELDTVRLRSNSPFARFRVVEGVFTDRAYIIGKVFFDDNENRIQDHNEQGIEGVKVYTEFGRYVVTDSEGKYHLDNVKPGSHILKLDSTTLPPYSRPELLSNRHFEDGEAMCVDVFPGDVFKANFGLLAEAPVETTESWQHPMAGLVSFGRTFIGLQRDASSGIVRLRHQVMIRNTSELPLYEFVYSEHSSYPPLGGSSYLNDAPFEDPKKVSEQFIWLLPLLEPNGFFEIKFASEIPKKAPFVRAELAFQEEPSSEPIKLVAKIPASLTVPYDYAYRLTAYFEPEESNLSSDAHSLIHRLGLMLNRLPFDRLFVRVQEYPEGDSSTALKKHLVQDKSLKKQRKSEVKDALRRSLPRSRETVFE